MKIAVAESCTGGLIANRITNIQGASDYFDMGFVTYSNDSKELYLFVPEEIIAEKGAVSSEVAKEMAEGVKETTEADVALVCYRGCRARWRHSGKARRYCLCRPCIEGRHLCQEVSL